MHAHFIWACFTQASFFLCIISLRLVSFNWFVHLHCLNIFYTTHVYCNLQPFIFSCVCSTKVTGSLVRLLIISKHLENSTEKWLYWANSLISKKFKGEIDHTSHLAVKMSWGTGPSGSFLAVTNRGELLYLQIFFVVKPAKQFCSACVVFLMWTYTTHALGYCTVNMRQQ